MILNHSSHPHSFLPVFRWEASFKLISLLVFAVISRIFFRTDYVQVTQKTVLSGLHSRKGMNSHEFIQKICLKYGFLCAVSNVGHCFDMDTGHMSTFFPMVLLYCSDPQVAVMCRKDVAKFREEEEDELANIGVNYLMFGKEMHLVHLTVRVHLIQHSGERHWIETKSHKFCFKVEVFWFPAKPVKD